MTPHSLRIYDKIIRKTMSGVAEIRSRGVFLFSESERDWTVGLSHLVVMLFGNDYRATHSGASESVAMRIALVLLLRPSARIRRKP
jgi:hypothetical protein